jgi:uncharacterized protein YkwD
MPTRSSKPRLNGRLDPRPTPRPIRHAFAARRAGAAVAVVMSALAGAAPLKAEPAAPQCEAPGFAAAALARINELRAAGADCRSSGRFAPAPALAWSTPLAQAAARHALDMAAQGLFSHTGSDGSSLSERVQAAGYAWRLVGENVAMGQADIDSVTAGWLARDGHCANLMDPRFTDAGLACRVASPAALAPSSRSAPSTHRLYWTLDLARPR